MNSRLLNRGLTLVEVLVAASIMAVCLAAISSLFLFAFKVTTDSDKSSIGYNLARREIERIRYEGFKNSIIVRDSNGVITSQGRDGSQTSYFDYQGNPLGNSSGAAYSVLVSITSDRMDTINGVQRPSDDALRTVLVTVTDLITGTVVAKDGTVLARSGI